MEKYMLDFNALKACETFYKESPLTLSVLQQMLSNFLEERVSEVEMNTLIHNGLLIGKKKKQQINS